MNQEKTLPDWDSELQPFMGNADQLFSGKQSLRILPLADLHAVHSVLKRQLKLFTLARLEEKRLEVSLKIQKVEDQMEIKIMNINFE